eukprot:363163-Chlamydomonas_euryale.AAC.4
MVMGWPTLNVSGARGKPMGVEPLYLEQVLAVSLHRIRTSMLNRPFRELRDGRLIDVLDIIIFGQRIQRPIKLTG